MGSVRGNEYCGTVPEGVLRSHLGKVFTNFSVNANLGRLRSIQVYVVGQAEQPGTV